jgi:hypothetical protein
LEGNGVDGWLDEIPDLRSYFIVARLKPLLVVSHHENIVQVRARIDNPARACIDLTCVMNRAIFSKNLADERSDGEEEEEELDVHADLNGALKVD